MNVLVRCFVVTCCIATSQLLPGQPLPDFTISAIDGQLKKGGGNDIEVLVENLGKRISAVLTIQLEIRQNGNTQKHSAPCKISRTQSKQKVTFSNISLPSASEVKVRAQISLSKNIHEQSIKNNRKSTTIQPAPYIREGPSPRPRKSNS
ncbi:MAG: hypothetical protein KTR24_15060 [Saprospiraceae bacterium]|nr:hypothetical protein [Saprospiraceae bacterium]